jgi:hypothetical protein
MKNETAVQKLFSVIEGVNQYALDNPLWETMLRCKARLMEIEKEQIKDAHLSGLINTLKMEASKQAEQYYNDTYGS